MKISVIILVIILVILLVILEVQLFLFILENTSFLVLLLFWGLLLALLSFVNRIQQRRLK